MNRTLALTALTEFAAQASAQVAYQDAELSSVSSHPFAFGSVVAADGSWAIVGAPGSQVSSILGSGLAEIFERAPDGSWTSQVELHGTTMTTLGGFGAAADIDGDIAAVSYNEVQLAEVFERDMSGTWSHAQTLAEPAGLLLYKFGRSLALEGDRLVVTASGSSSFGAGPGAVVVFERSGGVFTFDQAVFEPAVVIAGISPTSFGTSVDMSGDVVVVGDPNSSPPGFPQSGHVFVFERNGSGTWLATQTMTAPAVTGGALYGRSVSIDGDRLAIGAPGELGGSGRVYVYERTAGGPFIHQMTINTPSLLNMANSGTSVDLNGDRLAIGEPGADVNGSNAGLVRLYERTSAGTWVPIVALGHVAPVNGDLLGDGLSPMALLDDELLVGHRNRNTFQGAMHSYSIGGLFRGQPEISLAAGGSQSLLVRAGEARANNAYVILGSFSGTSPGIPLAPGVELPLVFDAYTNLGVSFSSPVVPAVGVLDALGRVDAAFPIPAGSSPSFAGSVIHHAALTIDLVTFDVGATNAVRVDLTL